MLDEVLMNDGCRWVPLAGNVPPLCPDRLVQSCQTRDNLATDNSRDLAAPGSGLTIFGEAVCHKPMRAQRSLSYSHEDLSMSQICCVCRPRC